MANVKFSLYGGNLTKKGAPVKLVIRKHNERKLIALGLFAKPEQWDEDNQRYKTGKSKGLHPDRFKNNEYLNRKELEAQDIIEEFEKERIDWTLNQFENRFLNKSHQGNVYVFFQQLVNDLRSTGHIGNAICYERTIHMISLFDSDIRKRVFCEIDFKYITSFDTWLQTPRETNYEGNRTVKRNGCCGNTRKYYHKALRAVLNKAIQMGEATVNSYPYGKGKFEVAKLEEITAKRYLSENDIEKIKHTPVTNGIEEVARKLFLFSYYCHGISYVDMAQLSHENIFEHEDGKYIIYKRQKIKNQKMAKLMSIKITPELSTLLDWFKNNTILISDYLTPCISRDYSGEQLYNHITTRYHRYNSCLKNLAKDLNIKFNLTSYVSRHSIAMKMRKNNIPIEIISQVLGHNNTKTTNVYLDSFGDDTINDAVKVL